MLSRIPLFTPENMIIATLRILVLFIPYPVRKSQGKRPPLMHMASIYQDIPLLQRAIDIENRGDYWNFGVGFLL